MCTNKKIFIILTIVFFFASCRNTKIVQLKEIFVDIDQSVTLPLSVITDEITAIELELTDESITSPQRINKVLFLDDNLIIVESNNILVYSMNGKFIRSIGSRGQGPGEYNYIINAVMDKKNNLLFVLSSDSKILCYDLNGNNLKNITQFQFQRDGFSIYDLAYINDNFFLIVEQWQSNENKMNKLSAILKLNTEFQITDSCIIRDDGFKKITRMYHFHEYSLFYNNSIIYIYYPDLYADEGNPIELVLRDTLYRFEKNNLIPELKLVFKNNGLERNGNKYIQLSNFYRSSRYVFAVYGNRRNSKTYRYCFDTVTTKGYNVLNDEFIDDIHQIGDLIKIRPVTMNTEYYYYLHTNMNPNDLEEPNPTLYIGKLKK